MIVFLVFVYYGFEFVLYYVYVVKGYFGYFLYFGVVYYFGIGGVCCDLVWLFDL